MEEAALIASEYISTLDNLPNEVQHLLAEIRLKEDRSNELQTEIQSKTQRYIRHTVKSGAASTKEPPSGIDDYFTELETLAAQKVKLAQRISEILTRACGRLEVDIARASAASGEPGLDLVGAVPALPSQLTGQGSWAHARAATDKIKDALKAEIVITPDLPMPHPTVPSSITTFKKRRLNPPTAASTPTPSNPTTPARSGRVTIAVARSSRRSESVVDADADGEEDGGRDPGDLEDQELYCYCRKLSYGEMVGCDNPDCPYQWFHLSCTGIKGPLPESWYCADCAPKFQFGGPSEKSRKGRRPRGATTT